MNIGTWSAEISASQNPDWMSQSCVLVYILSIKDSAMVRNSSGSVYPRIKTQPKEMYSKSVDNS